MATIERRVAKDSTLSFRVKIRRAGFPLLTATFARLSEARAWARQEEGRVVERRYFPERPGTRTVEELLTRYLAEVLPHESPQAQRNKPIHLRFWRETYGVLPAAALTPQLLASARDTLAQTHSAGTVNRYLTSLSAVCTRAVREWAWLTVNPVRQVRRPAEPNGRVRWLTDDERERLLRACQASANPRLFLIVLLGIVTGCRKMELLRLTWADVDVARQRLRVYRAKTRRWDSVPVPEPAFGLLQQASSTRRPETALLFPRADGQAPVDIAKAWQTALRRAGIPHFRFHDLRHTFASYLAMNGATVREIAEALGDTTLEMAMRYSHLSEEHTTDVIIRMTQRVFAPAAPGSGSPDGAR